VSKANGKGTTAQRTTKRQSALRFEILNAFVDQGMSQLIPHESVVWFVLFRDTKPDGLARTSVEDIARRAGVGRRTVLRALKRLEQLRMVKVVRRGGLNRGASSYRVFPFPAPNEWG
jgi:DNA-binding transcriptional ArsR family regulator